MVEQVSVESWVCRRRRMSNAELSIVGSWSGAMSGTFTGSHAIPAECGQLVLEHGLGDRDSRIRRIGSEVLSCVLPFFPCAIHPWGWGSSGLFEHEVGWKRIWDGYSKERMNG
jgi:hypothetical protein